MSEPSIFTKIINGEIPCHKVYEDSRTLAFLDINPVAEGHTLVIPKTEVEFVWDLSDEDYQAVMNTAKRIALRLREITGKPYVGEKVVGVDVPHAHVHLIPFASLEEFFPPTDKPRETAADPDHKALAEMAKKLAF
jgi:histidine triad (HIT) family protein